MLTDAPGVIGCEGPKSSMAQGSGRPGDGRLQLLQVHCPAENPAHETGSDRRIQPGEQ
ncbi:hypothetical protein [Spongiactinospora sp. 9N601]|uniref:hypothetical protein n=1 Tax=Spongiactinospora sp. 9N601 TaxID=3375149 RepID=UPI0037A87D52